MLKNQRRTFSRGFCDDYGRQSKIEQVVSQPTTRIYFKRIRLAIVRANCPSLFKIFSTSGSSNRKTLDPTYYVDIKSEGLRDILRTVLRGIRAVNLNEDKPTVEQNLLFNYLDELQFCQDNANTRAIYDPASLKHLELLVDFIKTTYKSTAQCLLSLLEDSEITYDLLWALFKPNSMVYSTCFGTEKLRYVMYDSGEEGETSNGLKYYKMECRCLDYDGHVFGESPIDLAIVKFRGKKRISTLNAFPLQYHPDAKGVRRRLVECGRRFVSMLGPHYRHCQGTAFYIKEGEAVTVSVDSRVMLDAAFFRKMNPNYTRPQPNELAKKKRDNDEWAEMFSESSSEGSLDRIKGNDVEPTKIEEKDLLICCPTVPGFGLGDKLWMEHPAPLYSISTGELSLDSGTMEVQLSRIFQTANHWNALILLDEADVYTERRSKQDVARNKLVSVFLRKLEYCEGIMFLTTNRVSDFDEAILSRIHLMLKYQELGSGVRSQIWKHMLHQAHTSQGRAVIADKEMEGLAKAKLNGRQIKNVVAIAHALATKKNTRVAYPHLVQAVKASENFIREFNGMSIVESLYY
ncbi:MAG: hypothetical protein Q9217_002283 [Psora testacea]